MKSIACWATSLKRRVAGHGVGLAQRDGRQALGVHRAFLEVDPVRRHLGAAASGSRARGGPCPGARRRCACSRRRETATARWPSRRWCWSRCLDCGTGRRKGSWCGRSSNCRRPTGARPATTGPARRPLRSGDFRPARRSVWPGLPRCGPPARRRQRLPVGERISGRLDEKTPGGRMVFGRVGPFAGQRHLDLFRRQDVHAFRTPASAPTPRRERSGSSTSEAGSAREASVAVSDPPSDPIRVATTIRASTTRSAA